MSESAMHQSFAEAIANGRPDSGQELEIITGLRHLPADSPNRPHWYSYPQWGCMTARDVGEDSTPTKKSVISIRDKLSEAKTQDEVHHLITGKTQFIHENLCF